MHKHIISFSVGFGSQLFVFNDIEVETNSPIYFAEELQHTFEELKVLPTPSNIYVKLTNCDYFKLLKVDGTELK